MDRMDDFINGRLIVLTDNFEEVEEFFKECEEEGLRWSSGHSLIDKEYYARFGINQRTGFGYRLDSFWRGINYGSEESWQRGDYSSIERINYRDILTKDRYFIECQW